jgi:beta-N-acetylhexosaminidase
LSSSTEFSAVPAFPGHDARAVVFGCAGTALSDEERRFFAETDPYGFILFKRNIADPAQVRALVAELRDTVGRKAPVLIDQEGGRVARLGPPHWPSLPPQRVIGIKAEQDLRAGLAAARALGRVIGSMLADLGIDIACAPVADLLLPETHAVIGNRAFSADPFLVGELACAVAFGLRDTGVTPIVKHIPGHGRATADSHLDLPRISTDSATLEATDFAAFRAVDTMPWAMVAHCVYTEIDPERPASISRAGIGVIRDGIGFGGVLIADDIGMKALQGTFAENAAATLAAGCDLTLHFAPAVHVLTEEAVERLSAAAAWMGRPEATFDLDAERALLAELVP